MRHSILSDLTVGLLAAGVPFLAIEENVPIRDIAEAQDGLSRYKADPNSRFAIEWGMAHSEALASILALVSDRDLAAAVSLAETTYTFESGLLLDHIADEVSNREARASFRDEADLDDDAPDWDDAMSYDEPGDDASAWDMDDDEIDLDWDSRAPSPDWDMDHDVAF